MTTLAAQGCGEISRADNALEDLSPDASDQTIAEHIADCLLAYPFTRKFRLSIFHDVRPSSKRRRTYGLSDPNARRDPCPVTYDWQHKNLVGIDTDDRERARQWIIEAQMLGYSVSQCWHSKGGAGSGKGTIAEWRKRQKERAERHRAA